jgi:hypothetical protein
VPSYTYKNRLSPEQSHELKVALFFWIAVAGLALLVANALAAAV